MCWPSSVLQFAPRACLLYTESLMTGGYNYLVFAILACFVKASLWGTQEMKTRQFFFKFPSHPGLLGKGGRIARVLFFLSTHFNLFCLSLIFLKEILFFFIVIFVQEGNIGIQQSDGCTITDEVPLLMFLENKWMHSSKPNLQSLQSRVVSERTFFVQERYRMLYFSRS